MSHEVKQCLNAVRTIMIQQPADKCRKNVLETINILCRDHSDEKDLIEHEFKEMCEELHVDFFETWKETFYAID